MVKEALQVALVPASAPPSFRAQEAHRHQSIRNYCMINQVLLKVTVVRPSALCIGSIRSGRGKC